MGKKAVRQRYTVLFLIACCAFFLSGCESFPIAAEVAPAASAEQSVAITTDGEAETAPDTVAETASPPDSPCPEPAPPVVEPEPMECPAPPKPKPCPRCPAAVVADKTVFGETEEVTIDPPGFQYTARIDTGAEGTSIHATNIVRFERDGDSWVRFELTHPKTGATKTLERELVRRVRVKQVELDGYERRLVVMLDLSIGQVSGLTEISLVDRSGMEYPVLIGRNFLQNQVVVDVSQQFIAH